MALKLITTSPVRSGVRQFCLQSFSSVNKKLQALKRSLGSQSTDENLALAKKHLQSLIELRGPLSIATFMQQVEQLERPLVLMVLAGSGQSEFWILHGSKCIWRSWRLCHFSRDKPNVWGGNAMLKLLCQSQM